MVRFIVVLPGKSVMKIKVALLGLAAVLAAAVIWTIVAQKPMAPEVTLTTLNGAPMPLSKLRGQVVLVNFWATTCTTCVGEMPMLKAVQEKFAPQGYTTVAVAMDYDPKEFVTAFVQRTGLPFTFALDSNGAAAKAFGGVRLTPTSYLIDKQGRIVQQYLGAPRRRSLSGPDRQTGG
jgi:peroxiredoxin